NAEGQFRRAAEQSKEVADSHWSGILDSLTRNRNLPDRLSELCFNWSSPLVRRLALLKDAERQKLAIGMLYVQAMLFAQQPLRVGEMKLLNTGLLGLIEIGLGDEAGDGDT
ncbi:MAG: HSP90 family protein, partial [Planctomycetota bacterium]